jgi:hypothetical protein
MKIKKVLEVFPNLNRRTLGAWIEGEIIQPESPSTGERVAAEFSEENLKEIALLLQFHRAGIDSRDFLKKLFRSPTQKGQPLIKYLQSADFLIVPVLPFYQKKLTAKEEADHLVAFWRREDQMADFFKGVPACGWIVIDFRVIKAYVENRLTKP